MFEGWDNLLSWIKFSPTLSIMVIITFPAPLVVISARIAFLQHELRHLPPFISLPQAHVKQQVQWHNFNVYLSITQTPRFTCVPRHGILMGNKMFFSTVERGMRS